MRLWWVLAVPSRPVGDFALYREAAAYLFDQGQLDGEFVYMPGYVMVLAALRACGGELLADKMVGVVAGTALVFAAGGIAHALFGRRAGILATFLAAIWPAGIAAASVTGTDVPAGALTALGVYALVRLGPRRPGLAAVACGVVLGLAAWVRAVAAPLAGLSFLYWVAAGVRWPRALTRTAVAMGLAFLVLMPWGLRNRRLYGELFFTDSHGGNTALVGANPNSEGTYSRSLNLMFTKGTGYRLFEPPARHRQSDRAAYEIAKQWTAFEPVYAAGLVVAKADRLLTHERNLLYWPVFRQGVLDQERRAFFDVHRTLLERATDLYWWGVAGLAAAGLAICAHKRWWIALAILAFPAALVAIYALFFAEVRYHLAIVPLLFPYAACALDWSFAVVMLNFAARRDGHPLAGEEWRATALIAVAAVVALFVSWSAALAVGNVLRARHRWAVTVCEYPLAGQTHLCSWRRSGPAGAGRESPVRGTWQDVGLRVHGSSERGVMGGARTEVPVGAGRFRVRGVVFMPQGSAPQGLALALRANGRVIARAVSPWQAERGGAGGADGGLAMAIPLQGVAETTESPLVLEVEAEPADIGSSAEGTIWVSQLVVERF